MSTVSKEILDKLRQLSDLLIVIKDSGNNTPQILKELAVEKCSEIYSALSSEEVVEYKIAKTPKEEKIDEPTLEEEPTEIVFNEEVVSEESLREAQEECESAVEEEQKEKSIELPTFSIEDTTQEEEKVEIITEPEIQQEEVSFEEETESLEDEVAEEDNFEVEEEEEFDEEEEKFIDIDVEVDLFSPKENNKKCNHKKIRSVLSINDIFLYKRELFGNSDVDMTDIFDGIDEAESLEDAMELISEYFGSDVESEEMVIEFVERVKQCFE